MKIHPKIKVIRSTHEGLSGLMSGKYSFNKTVFEFEQNDNNRPIISVKGELVESDTSTAIKMVDFTMNLADKKAKQFWLSNWFELWKIDIELLGLDVEGALKSTITKDFESWTKVKAKQVKVFDSYVELYRDVHKGKVPVYETFIEPVKKDESPIVIVPNKGDYYVYLNQPDEEAIGFRKVPSKFISTFYVDGVELAIQKGSFTPSGKKVTMAMQDSGNAIDYWDSNHYSVIETGSGRLVSQSASSKAEAIRLFCESGLKIIKDRRSYFDETVLKSIKGTGMSPRFRNREPIANDVDKQKRIRIAKAKAKAIRIRMELA